jgi:4-hydroxy-tetrahydrodipicolinate reductase
VPVLQSTPDIEYVGGFGSGGDVGDFLRRHRPQVLVEFTRPEAARANALAAVEAGAVPVIGTSGLSEEAVQELEAACARAGLGGIVAPNFALGAVLLIWLAEKAAPYFEAVEVIEQHHQGKRDAPSGTALSTARRLAAAGTFTAAHPAVVTLPGARGGEEGGVSVHSVRLPGVVADQEVLFGAEGQTLSLAHRTTGREAYAPGVLIAIRELVRAPRFHRGLDALLGLS